MIKKILFIVSGIVLFWVCGLLLYSRTVMTLAPYHGNAEGIVVLTGGDGRIEAGLDILEAHKADRLLISGVHRDVTVEELLALNNGNPALAPRIELGFIAQDTLGNADETAAWIEAYRIESLIVVTALYHMPRALMHLGHVLPDVALYPYPVVPKAFQNTDWLLDPVARRFMVQEYNKFLATYPQILFLKQEAI